jgi:hypothetical protein
LRAAGWPRAADRLRNGALPAHVLRRMPCRGTSGRPTESCCGQAVCCCSRRSLPWTARRWLRYPAGPPGRARFRCCRRARLRSGGPSRRMVAHRETDAWSPRRTAREPIRTKPGAALRRFAASQQQRSVSASSSLGKESAVAAPILYRRAARFARPTSLHQNLGRLRMSRRGLLWYVYLRDHLSFA